MANPTTEYQLIEEWSHQEFVAAVNDALKDGWQLQGGVSIAVTERHDRHGNEDFEYTYAQAMVKHV